MTTDGLPPPILLVEDNPVDIDLTLRAFSSKRFVNTIEVARDGEEALAYFPKWEAGESLPAVILLDIKLPKVNGLEVLRQLKSHKRFNRIPVVMLTSSDDNSDLRMAYDLGVNSYIVKPVDFGKFMTVAEQVELYWCVLNRVPR